MEKYIDTKEQIDLETKISKQSASAQARRYRLRHRSARESNNRLVNRMKMIIKKEFDFYDDPEEMRFQMIQIYHLVADIDAALKM